MSSMMPPSFQQQQQHLPEQVSPSRAAASLTSGVGLGSGGALYQRPDAFKNQLWKLNQEIEGFSKKLTREGGGMPPPPSTAHPSTGLGLGYQNADQLTSQVGGLYQSMEQVNTHLRKEGVEKRQLQDELDQLKAQFGASSAVAQQQQAVLQHHHQQLHQQQQVQSFLQPALEASEERYEHRRELEVVRERHEKEIKDRQEEVTALREEKAVMKEWLDRGVGECRRVAEEVQRLRSELDENDGEKDRLRGEKQKLEKMLEQVMSEVRDATAQLELTKTEGTLKDKLAAEHSERLQRTEAENERLAAEVSRLMQRVRDSEEGELHLRSLVAGIKRLAAGFLALHAAIENDRLGDLMGLAELQTDENDGSGTVEHVAAQGKGSLAEMNDVLLALRSSVRSRFEESQERLLEVARREGDTAQRAVEGARRSEQELRERHSIEKRLLEGKLEELEGELSALSETNVRSQQQITERDREAEELRERLRQVGQGQQQQQQPQRPPSVADGMLQSMTRFDGNDEQLAARLVTVESRCAKLEASNVKLKEKNKKLKVDWGKVSDIRQHCQRLEAEKKSMQDYIERLEVEAEGLRKRTLNASLYQGDPTAPATRLLSPSKRTESDHTSAIWKEWQRSQASFNAWQQQQSRLPSPTASRRPLPASSQPLPTAPRVTPW